MSGRSFNWYFTLLPPVHECFPQNRKIACHTQWSSLDQPRLGLASESYFIPSDFGEGRKSGGASLCIPLLNEIRASDSEDGSSRILLSNLVVSFDIRWSTVQRSFYTQLFGTEWDTCFCARVVSFLSITLVLGVRVETFLHLIFVWNQVTILSLFIGLYKKTHLALSPALALWR